MVELSWAETTPLSRVYSEGRHGAGGGMAGVSLCELTGFELVQVMARRGQWSAVEQACQTAYGMKPPASPGTVMAAEALLIWSGPGQFLILSRRGNAFGRAGAVFSGTASLAEQSDGRALLKISGARARGLLAKVCSLDLHHAQFAAGAAAATSMDHSSVNLWRGPDEDRDEDRDGDGDGAAVFYVLLFTTFAESLWNTIVDSGAEYGIALIAPAAWQP